MEECWTAAKREKYIRGRAAAWVAALHPRLRGSHVEVTAFRHKDRVSEIKTQLRGGGERFGFVVCFADPTGNPLPSPELERALRYRPAEGKWHNLPLPTFPAAEPPTVPAAPAAASARPRPPKPAFAVGTWLAWILIVFGLLAVFPPLRDIVAGLRSYGWETTELLRAEGWYFVDPAGGGQVEIEEVRFSVARESGSEKDYAVLFRLPPGWWEAYPTIRVHIDRSDLHRPVLGHGIPPESSGLLILASALPVLGLSILLELRRGRRAGLSEVETLRGSGKMLLGIGIAHVLSFALYTAAAFLWCHLLLLPFPGWPALIWLGVLAVFALVPGLWLWAYSNAWFRWFLLQLLILLLLPPASALLGLSLPFLLAGLTAILLLAALISVCVPKYLPQNVARLVWMPLFLAGTAAPFRALCLLAYQLAPNVPYHAPPEFLGNVLWVARFDLAVGIAGIAVILGITLLDTFWRLRQARQVENLPTSKARSAALGIAEFRGRARRLDGEAGEILASAGEGMEVVTPFYLEDDTGRILVDPRGAKFRRGRASSYGGRTLDIVLSQRVTPAEIARPMSMRLLAGDEVYVIGNVMANSEAPPSAVGQDALVVKPLQEPGIANSFARLFLGKTEVPPARDIHHVFFLADSGEERARRWIMRGVTDIWGKAVVAVALCFFLVAQQLPRATGGREQWSFAETLAVPSFKVATVDYLADYLLREGAPYRHARENWLNDFAFTRRLVQAKERQERTAALNFLWNQVDTPAYREAAPALARLLVKCDEPEIRRYAAWALGKVKAPPEMAVPILLPVLQETAPQMRIAAIQSLAGIAPPGAPEVTTALLNATGDGDPEVARIALWALRERRGLAAAEVLPVLVRLLRHADVSVRHEAANVLATLDAEALPALEPLREALADPEYNVVNSAVVAIGAIGPAAAPAVPELISLLASTTYGTKQFTATALGRIGPAAHAALPALQDLLQDSNQWVRQEAELAIRKIAGS